MPNLRDLTPLPAPAAGVLTVPLGDGALVYDLVREVAHRLSARARIVWERLDGSTTTDEVVRALVDVTGGDVDEAHQEVLDFVGRLRQAGLVERDQHPAEPVPRPAVRLTGSPAGPVLAVIDDGVVLHSDDPSLLAGAAELFAALLSPDRAGTVTFSIERAPHGVAVEGLGPRRTFASVDAALEHLTTDLNRVAATNEGCLTLHAGGVRSPAGEVWLLPASSQAGKSTLTAALVQAGWDYLSDEAVGLRHGASAVVPYPKPLVLEPASRRLLGIETPTSLVLPATIRRDVVAVADDVGPITRVVLPAYQAGAMVEVEALSPEDAAIAVLEHALNLRRVGRPGLEAIAQLVSTVPCVRLVHGDARQAAKALTALET